ncbi:YadA-like family protein [Lysobacter arvi]|uniref:YadA-like family protein n=1 Tax=Lysobacter arvi TaxID=3038776 RepID=A0ABU1CIC6_9GAMM|nr:YadA-like family protein [Lysobacter arvi]MDR0184688.1 YadA-like family protein [Lysobacter arvi]
MNKIYRVVWNAESGQWVVASEMAKGRKKKASGSGVLVASAVVATSIVLPGSAFASIVINGNPQETGIGCSYILDENPVSDWDASQASSRCLVPAGSSASGQGDPGKRVLFYSSDDTNGNEDSVNIGGYLDTWKTATFHGGVDMANTKITNLANGTNPGDAVNFGQMSAVDTKVTNAQNQIDAIKSGTALSFSANSGTNVDRKLGETLAIKGAASTAGTYSGNNLKTVTDTTTGAINIQMADAPKFGNITINDSGKITGLTDGTAATDAVTKGQMDTAVSNAGKWKIQANAGTADTITSADTINVADGKNTTVAYDATANKLTVGVVDNPTFSGLVTAQGGLDMASKKITNVADGTVSSTSKDAVNGSQLNTTNQNVTNVTNTVNNITNGGGIKYFHVNSTLADSTAGGADSTAIGPAASVNASAGGGIAMGRSSSVTANATYGGVAIGTAAKADANDALAFGRDSSASAADGVALGHSSKADRASGAGGSTMGAVSVGSGGTGAATGTRQIISVARGTQDTDAVNVSQLKGVTTALGGGSTVNADGTVKAPSYTVNGNTYNDVGSALSAAAASSGNVDALKWSTTASAYDAAHGSSATNKIVNVADGTVSSTSKDAVNGSQLNTTNQNVTNVTNTVNNITNGGGIKYFHVNSTLADSTAGGTDSTAIGPAASVNASAGGGIAMGRSSSVTANATYGGVAIGTAAKADANDALAFGRDASASAADGVALGHSSKADRASGAGGSTMGAVSVGSGGTGAATGTRQIISVARGTQDTDAVNLSQLKSVVTDLGGGAAVNADGTIKAPAYDVNGTTYTNVGGAVDALDSRMDTLSSKPLSFSANSGTKVDRKLGETLTIKGAASTAGTFSGNNIKTVTDTTTGTINIQMADAPKFGNITINDSGKITGLTDGTAATDAVTKGQLDAAVISAGAGWKIKANTSPEGTIKGGDTLNVVDGTNTKVAFDSSKNELKVSVADAPTFSGMVTANGGLTVGAGKVVDMGGNKITKVAAGTASTDAVNVSQLKGIADAIGGGTAINPTTGAITPPTFDMADGTQPKTVADAIDNLDGRVQEATDGIDGLDGKITDLGNKGLTFGGNTGTVQRKLGETLTIKGLASTAGTYSGNNIKTVADGTTGAISIQMAEAPKFGNITINDSGKITGLTDGTAATDAVTKGQLDAAVISAGAGWKIKANTSAEGTIKGGDTLNVVDGTNTKVAFDSSKNQLKVSVADAPTFSGMVTANGGLTVGAGKVVDMGGNKITKVAAGTADTDAVNVSQLKGIAEAIGGGTAVDPTTGAITQPEFQLADGTKADSVADAIDNLDGRVEDVKDGLDGLNADMEDVVKYDTADHDKVTFNADGDAVVLDNVAGGSIAEGSKEAINGGQAYEIANSVAEAIGGGSTVNEDGTISKPEFSLEDGETVVDNVGDAIDNLDDRTTANTDALNDILDGAGIKYFHANSTLADSQAKGVESVAIGGNAIANAKNSVALGSNSLADRENTISVGSKDGTRQIVYVKAGVQDTDAVNVSQLKGIADAIGGGTAINPTTGAITPPTFELADGTKADSVADAIDNLDGRVEDVKDGIDGLNADMEDVVKYDTADHDKVTFNADGDAVVLDNVAGGSITEGSKEAINGGQAYDIANSVVDALGGGSTVNEDGTISMPKYEVTNDDGTTTKVDGVEGAITNLDQRTYDNTTNITNLTQQITEGSVGLVQYDDETETVTVAAGKGGTMVDFANVDGESRQLKHVADGTEDEDAVNVSQLRDALGGSTTDEDGNYVGPSYTIINQAGEEVTVHNVGDAFTTIDGRVTNLYQQINEGSVGLVQQAAAGEKLTVGKDTDGAEVNFTGTAGDRKLTGVEDGTVSETSHDAVNGSQLYTVAQSVADAIGGGSTVDKDGSITAPTYNVTNVDGTTTEVHNVGDAVTNLDQRTYSNTTKIENITNQINNSGIGMVQQAAPGEDITVGKGTDGKAVNFTGTAGDRVLTGVAAGSADNDAINVKQLKDAGIIDASGNSKSVVTYDNAEKTSITMGGEGASTPVAIHNVADGVADHDAVNVQQLNQRLSQSNTEVLNQANSYTDKMVNDVWQNLGDAINEVNQQANRGIAAASALVNVTPYLPGHTAVNAGVASYRGEAALGVGVSRWSDNGRVNFNAGVSAAKGDEPVFRVGIGYVF